MFNDIIRQHREEKEKILSRKYVERNQVATCKRHLKTDLIKVITGPRRAGKSVFLFLLLQKCDFAYLNFEDDDLLKTANYDNLMQGITEVYPDAGWLFFDEIQNFPKWELFVNKLHRRGYNLLLTGSNANLLSKELASALTGRYIPIEILPFGFGEFLQAKNIHYTDDDLSIPERKGKLFSALQQYLENGGYPEPATKELDVKNYLETLFDAVLLKDVVKRYKIRFAQKLYELAQYLMSNAGSEYTFSRLKKSLGFKSTNTVQQYAYYLEETYLFFSLNRFSFKVKEQVRAPRKVYVVDNGFITSKGFHTSYNTGKLMENAVFVELLRKGYQANKDLFYYKTRNNREIDFVLKKGIKAESLLQVCLEVKNPETKKREIKALLESAEELECDNLQVITFDYEETEIHANRQVIFTPLWKWLLRPQ